MIGLLLLLAAVAIYILARRTARATGFQRKVVALVNCAVTISAAGAAGGGAARAGARRGLRSSRCSVTSRRRRAGSG